MKKKVLIILASIVGVIIAYSLMWFLNNQIVFNKYEKGFEDIGINKTKSIKEYTLSVKKSDYGSFTGNLAITNEDGSLTIIIWPSLFGMENGIMINEDNNTYQIMVKKNFDVLDETDEYGKQLIEKYREDLSKMKEIANDEWNIY
ncbi:MAG: hypothetical protein ABF649_14575 [Bacillus sp. (in: firmicutes)]